MNTSRNRKLNHQASKQKQSKERVVVSHSAGPMPNAEMIEAYERICPGSAQRFFSHVEKEIVHRHSIEQAHSQSNISISERIAESSIEQVRVQNNTESEVIKKGAFAGIITTVGCLICAFYFGYKENNTMAIAFLGTPLIGGFFKGLAKILGKNKINNPASSEEK